MRAVLRPLPRTASRILTALVLVAWVVQMARLVQHSVLEASSSLAADLDRYGSGAQWRGVYSRGEKIGFVVTQTLPRPDGYEIQEDGRLQMTLLGATTAARMHTSVTVDRAFAVRAFAFRLDPGTGPVEIGGTVDGRRLSIRIKTPSGERTETRELPEPPALSLNLPRRLAAEGLAEGKRFEVLVFDPVTLRNSPMVVSVEGRDVVRALGRPVPTFRLKTTFSGLTSTSWVTELGETIKEESPTGLLVLKETRDRATALAVPGEVQMDLLESAAVAPEGNRRAIDDPTQVERLRLELKGGTFEGPDLQGAGQTASGGVFELVDPRSLRPGPRDPAAERHLAPEPFIESDAPEIVAEAKRAVGTLEGARARAERLVRHVNALLEKRPTVSLPSALEVLRTRVGDCNEHTVLYAALARALGIPVRIDVGLVYLRGAFYYHAWPEVWIEEKDGRGLWLPVDPTLNQFPADATHVRLARGGLEKQAAILPLIGQLQMKVLSVDVKPGSTPVLVGQAAHDTRPLDLPIPRADGSGRGCWSSPPR